MLVLVVDLLVIVLIAVLLVISFGISTKVIWSAIIAPSLYFFMIIRRWNVNKTGTHPVDGGCGNCCFFFEVQDQEY